MRIATDLNDDPLFQTIRKSIQHNSINTMKQQIDKQFTTLDKHSYDKMKTSLTTIINARCDPLQMSYESAV